MLSPKKLLENARNRISKRENWTRFALATTVPINGHELPPGLKVLDPLDPTATCWCAEGALMAEAGVKATRRPEGDDIVNLLPEQQARLYPELSEALSALRRAAASSPFSSLHGINDSSTHEGILEVFDTAIANMRGE